ncbi:MAG: hypothetical protein WCI17_04420 [bacterium]|jgi:hypothetical protein
MTPDSTRTAVATACDADARRFAALRMGVGLIASFLCSAAAAALVALTNGNLLVVPAVCAGVLFVVLLVQHLEIGVYVLLAAVMLLDQFLVIGIPSSFSVQSAKFYQNLNYTTGIGALMLNPVELLLLLIVAGWFFRAVTTRKWHFHRVPNMGIAVVFLLMLVFFTGYGLLRGGGDWKAALWEIRSLYYLCFMYFLVTQVIRTSKQVRVCVWIIILGLSFRGLQGSWRYFFTLHRDLGHLRAILGHEDSLFFVTGFVLLASLGFLGYRGREMKVLAATALPNLIAFVFNQRRVTFGVLGLCLGLVVLLLPRDRFRLALRVIIPGALLLVMYTAMFWNSTGAKALPAQKIKSVFVKQEGSDDEGSNEWRKKELVNLRATLMAYPQGVGFGQKYLVVVPYADIGEYFPLWNYIPHCAIYWIWVKTGFAGFAVFWLFFGVAIVQGMIDYRAMRDPYLKAVSLMVVLFIVGQVVVSYYDLQLTYYRNMIYLGTAMALGTIVRRIDSRTPAVASGEVDGR